MKKILLLVALVMCSFSYAQKEGGFGIKAGTNYGSSGDLRLDGESIVDNPESNFGYHVGVFGKIDLGGIYIRPELIYTSLNSEYDGTTLELQKLDAPLLLGVKLIGPLHVFGGPSLQYILDTDLENLDIDRVQEDFTIGLQVGVGVNLGNLGIDIRYEDGLSENFAEFSGINNFGSVDTRPSQIILGLSLKL